MKFLIVSNFILVTFITVFLAVNMNYANEDFDKDKNYLRDASAEGYVVVPGIKNNGPTEHIFYRKVGSGKNLLVFLPGNNTSSVVYSGVLNKFSAVESLNRNYTAIAIDYRGSGKSSYNTPISALRDFALDIESFLSSFHDIESYEVSLIGYSMGFPVAIELTNISPKRYQSIVGLAPVGTRGIRADFNKSNRGVDSSGKYWEDGDWVPIDNHDKSIDITGFHQRAWQGNNRNFATVKNTWDMIVFNDSLKFDLSKNITTDLDAIDASTYISVLKDCLSIQYMPESLFYTHTFNASSIDFLPHTNSDGKEITISAMNKISDFENKHVLLVKAGSDINNWRGDLVIDDQSFSNTYDDLTSVGAKVTLVSIDAGHTYDHGMVITHPEKMVLLIDAFLNGDLTNNKTNSILEAPIFYRRN